MMTKLNKSFGNDQTIAQKKSSTRTQKLKQPYETLLKNLKTGDLFQLKHSPQFFYVEHQHNESTEVYKRLDSGKRIPFAYSPNVTVLVYPNGYIGEDNSEPDQKFKSVPLASIPVGGKFCFGKGKSLMRVEANLNHSVTYCFASSYACVEPFSSSGAIRVLQLIEKEVKNA